MTEENLEAKELESWILITFDHPGSCVFNIDVKNVIPQQLFVLSKYLEMSGEVAFAQQEYVRQQQESQKHIVVPKPGIQVAKK